MSNYNLNEFNQYEAHETKNTKSISKPLLYEHNIYEAISNNNSVKFVEILPESLDKGSTYISNNASTSKISDADNFLEHMQIIKQTVIDMLIISTDEFLTDIIYKQNYIPNDQQCRFQMGYKQNLNKRIESGLNPPTRFLHQKCRSCDAMDLLISLDDVKSNIPFYPNYGKMKNMELILFKNNNVYPSIIKVKSMNKLINKIIKQNDLAVVCQPSLHLLSNTKYYSLDGFTNYILTNWYIDYLLSSRNYSIVRRLYYPFICSNNGYMLMESKKYKTLQNYEITHVRQTWGILFQLFSTLHQLKDNQLSFQEINDQTFLLENIKCNYKYDEVNVMDDVTLIINDFKNISININDNSNKKYYRLYRGRKVADEYYTRINRKIIRWDLRYSLADKPGKEPYSWVTYQIAPYNKNIHDYGLLTSDNPENMKNNDIDAFVHVNKMGIPMYQGSFDAYRILLLLCSNNGFYYSLMNEKNLNILWRSLWTPLEYELINKRITDHSKYKDMKYPFTQMLLGFNLRCNLISHVWNQLKYYAHSNHELTKEIYINTDNIIQSP